MKALQSTPPVVARLVSTVTVGHCFSRLLWGGDGNRASSDAAELTVFTEIHSFSLKKCTSEVAAELGLISRAQKELSLTTSASVFTLLYRGEAFHMPLIYHIH